MKWSRNFLSLRCSLTQLEIFDISFSPTKWIIEIRAFSSNPTDVVLVMVSGLKIGKGAWYWDHRSWSMRYIRYSNLYLALIFQIQFGWENKLIHSKKTNFLRNIRQFWPKCERSVLEVLEIQKIDFRSRQCVQKICRLMHPKNFYSPINGESEDFGQNLSFWIQIILFSE